MVDSKKFVQKNFPKSLRATYIQETDVFEFVRRCDENDWAIVGVDGLERNGINLRPRLDMIADYSFAVGNQNKWNNFKVLCNTSAIKFFTKMLGTGHNENLVFDCTVYSKKDWGTSRRFFLNRLEEAQKKMKSATLTDEELFEIVRDGIYGGFSSKLSRRIIPENRTNLSQLFMELIDTLIK